MRNSKKKLYRTAGFTLLEAILVIAILSVIVGAVAPLFRTSVLGWEARDRRLELFQIARIAMDKMVREMKTSVEFSTVLSDEVDFLDGNGNSVEFKLDGNILERNGDELASPVSALTFTYYDREGDTTTAAADVYSAKIALTISDAEGKTGSVTMTSRAVVREDPLPAYTLAINEINYDPPGTGANERRREWVELYNYGADSVDMTNWQLSDSSNTDDLEMYPGETTMVVPAGGYAIITANDTTVYTYYSVAAGAINLEVDDNQIGNQLGNSGDTITISDPDGNTVDEVVFGDWAAADQTIERIDPETLPSEQSNWESSEVTGTYTPGSANTVT